MNKKRYELKEGFKFRDEYFSDLDKNLRRNMINRDTGSERRLMLFNGCLIDAWYKEYNKRVYTTIYNEFSRDQIRRTKSLLEKKTGWKLIPL